MSDMGKEMLFLRQVWCFMLTKATMTSVAMHENNKGDLQNRKTPDFELKLEAH